MKKALLILILGTCFGSVFSQPISRSTMHCATTQSNGDVVLDWSNIASGCGPFISYKIYAATNPNGPYILIDSITNQATTTWTHTGANGNTTVWYYYIVADYNCGGYTSSANSDTIDNQNPQTPLLNYVSVNSNGTTTFNWQASSSSKTYGYVIYIFVNGQYIPHDTVYGRFNTTYIDSLSSANSGSESYTVAALDSCGNIGAFNTSPHNTIYMTDTLYACSHTVTVNWDSYNNWPGVKSYDVFVIINSAVPKLVGQYSDTTFTASFSNISNLDTLCFWVQANEKGGGSYTSTSNEKCMIVHIIQPVSYCYIKRITTVADNQVDVSFILNKSAGVLKLYVQRSIDNNNFYTIAQLPVPPNFILPVSYSDMSVNAALNSYYYRLIAVDSCGDSTYSSSANNIVLSGYAFSNYTNAVQWTSFNFQYGAVVNYGIYHSYNNLPFTNVNLSSPNTSSYQEAIFNLPSTDGRFCYYVLAEDNVNYPNGMTDTTTCRSNIICVDQVIGIVVPNAIVPTGTNSVFKPNLVYTDITSYSMKIFNRWGETIFQTADFNQGWGGTHNGQLVEQGVYAYRISITDSHNNTTEKEGTVMVIR